MKILGFEIKRAEKPLSRKDLTYNKIAFQWIGNNQVLWMPEDPSKYIRDAYYLNPDVYSAVHALVNMASQAPLNLYKVADKKAAKKYKAITKGFIDTKSMPEVCKLRTKAFTEVEDHPLLKLLKKPNEWQSEQDFRANRLGFKLVTGNYYIYKAVPEVGIDKSPLGLYILPSQWMQAISGGLMEPIKEYVNMYGGSNVKVEAAKIIHNRSWSLDYSAPGTHIYGVSPLKAAVRAITMSNDSRTALVNMVQNGGTKGILSLPELTDGLAPEQMQQIKDQVKNAGGLENRGLAGVTHHKVEWHDMGLDAVEMSIIEALKWSRDDIMKVFGIDPRMYSMDASTYNNVKEAKQSTLSMGVIPLLISDRDSLNQGLLPHFEDVEDYYLDYDLTVYSELQENRKELFEALDKAYWLKPNEKRIESGYDEETDENMNKFYFPSGLEELGKLNTEIDMPNIPDRGDFEDDK